MYQDKIGTQSGSVGLHAPLFSNVFDATTFRIHSSFAQLGFYNDFSLP